MSHDPGSAILDMIQAIQTAQKLTAGVQEETFLADEKTQWAVFSQIVILGEAAGRLAKDFCKSNPAVPWSEITGMRHRLIHGYINPILPRGAMPSR